MFCNLEVPPNPLSVRAAASVLAGAFLAASFAPAAVAQAGSDGDAGQRAAETTTPAPLPTREQILSDPFLRNALSRSTEGLERVRRPDGAVKLDLQGRFQSISAARIGADGEVEIGCAETHDSLADFLAAHPSASESFVSGDAEEPDADDE